MMKFYKGAIQLVLFEDNQNCIKWLKNATGYHAKTKRIEICYHFVRELYQDELLQITYVTSENQNADILTKSLPSLKHRTILYKIRHLSDSGGMLEPVGQSMANVQ